MEMKVKDRSWVKNAVIVFLVILLILTFFSNTIMNRSLAEVATQSVSSGSITARVRGSGTVTAAGAYEVKAEQTRQIRAVRIKAGQEVSEGDVLFIFGEGSSEELEQAEEALRQLQLSRQRTASSYPSYDYSLDERKIEQLREQLDAALETEALAYLALENNGNIPASVLNEANAKVEAMQKRVDETRGALTAAQDAFSAKQDEAQARVDEALAHLNELLDNPPEDPEESDYQRLLDEAETALQAAQMAQSALDPSTDPGITNAQDALETAQSDLEAAEKELSDLVSQAGAYADAYAEAQSARKAVEDELFTAEYTLNQQKIANGKSAASTSIELQDLDYQIKKAQEKLDKLSGEEGEEVLAKVSGIIENIYYTAGNTAAKGDTLCTIQVPDLGYTLSFSVTNDQARRVRPGDEATISNYWWGREIHATLSGIRTDPQNPQNNKILTFDVSGDVNPGSELTLAVGSKSQNYDTIVPNSSIRSDTNGSFVLAVEAKNSPLGNRYYAKRVEVTVLASDDMNSAVTGDLGYGDFVITTSSIPVKSGDMVRMPG